jgi:hypothetical protein
VMNSMDCALYDTTQTEYGAVARYGHVFIDQMNCLYLLAFLVTADRNIAERCFTRALDEYVEGRGGFLDWASREGRLAVLRHSIQAINPLPRQAYSWTLSGVPDPMGPTAHHPFVAITSLSAFERFVFVMATVEGLSEEDCAALLECSVQEIAFGRELARRTVALADLPVDVTADADLVVVPMLLGNQICGVC